jgi:hypothetical protein
VASQRLFRLLGIKQYLVPTLAPVLRAQLAATGGRCVSLFYGSGAIEQAAFAGAALLEAATKTHSRLHKEPALVFLRLYEVFGRQCDPGLQREADDAREALAQVRTAVAEAGDDDAKEAARKRLDKAHALAERARRVVREAERRAEVRVAVAIQRALKEDWGFRHVENFYRATPKHRLRAPRRPARSLTARTKGTRPPRSAPLYVEDGRRLVVHRDRIARAGVDERGQLAGVLHRLLDDLQAARPADNTEVASGRGRDGPFEPPPARIRTGGFPASGSCLRS